MEDVGWEVEWEEGKRRVGREWSRGRGGKVKEEGEK